MAMQSMKAVVQGAYGSPEVLRLAELPKPVPRDDEILIRIHAASINGSDREGLIGKPLYARMGGLRKILGSDIAGRVELRRSEVDGFVERFPERDHDHWFYLRAVGRNARRAV